MIRALQKKFVITAMIAVTVLLLVVLGALNVFNAVSNTRMSDALLDELGRQPFPAQRSEGFLPAEGPGSAPPPVSAASPSPDAADDKADVPPAPDPDSRRRRSFLEEPTDDNARMSALYFVADLDRAGTVVSVNVSHIASVTESEANELARGLDLTQSEGTAGGFRYKIFPRQDGSSHVVFLDGSARRASVMRVLLLSGLLGALSWLLMLALVIALSRRAIRPIAENMERQRRFVTDAGHELKTPVAIILANVDAMELRGIENKYTRNIRSQAVRLGDLMKNLLTLARVDEYSVLEHVELLDFSALCRDLFASFREPAELKHIHFTEEITDGLQVHGDPNLLSQLCSILADNAVKYCPENGAIRISLRPEANRICLKVSNTVTDVPDVSRLFDRFYRADTARSQKSGGFGIGLSAARSIARLHKADLCAEYDPASGMLSFLLHIPL